MHKYRLSTKADNDLDSIADYTFEVWGENQTRKYITGLLRCFQSLSNQPSLGRSAAEYGTLLKKYNYKAHTIFYEPTKEGIFVVRILGHRQDFEQHL